MRNTTLQHIHNHHSQQVVLCTSQTRRYSPLFLHLLLLVATVENKWAVTVNTTKRAFSFLTLFMVWCTPIRPMHVDLALQFKVAMSRTAWKLVPSRSLIVRLIKLLHQLLVTVIAQGTLALFFSAPCMQTSPESWVTKNWIRMKFNWVSLRDWWLR